MGAKKFREHWINEFKWFYIQSFPPNKWSAYLNKFACYQKINIGAFSDTDRMQVTIAHLVLLKTTSIDDWNRFNTIVCMSIQESALLRSIGPQRTLQTPFWVWEILKHPGNSSGVESWCLPVLWEYCICYLELFTVETPVLSRLSEAFKTKLLAVLIRNWLQLWLTQFTWCEGRKAVLWQIG